MSFESVITYRRPILAPLSLPTKQNQQVNSNKVSKSRSPDFSSLWTATTHSFVGNATRQKSAAWPPSRFDEDPANIPEDEKYNILYEASTAALKDESSPDAQFRLYEKQGGTSTNANEMVPPPQLIVKRYKPRSSVINGPGLTLLLLPGMGALKEGFEPLIDILLPQTQRAGLNIEEIWSLDMPMSGENALVNPIGYF